MIRTAVNIWFCSAVGVTAIAAGGSATAQGNPATTTAEQKPALVCTTTCECECDRKDGGVRVTRYKNLILVNVGSTLAGRIEVEYERALHRIVSIFSAAYVLAFDSVGNQNLVGLGGLVGSRVYMVGGAPEGVWVAWEFGFAHRIARRDRDITLSGPQTGGMLGYTGVWGRFALTFGVGGQFAWSRLTVRGESETKRDWEPWLKFGLGVAF